MFYKTGGSLNPGDTVIIYGAGREGILTCITLLNYRIYVSAFCDANPALQGIKVMNKRVLSPDELLDEVQRSDAKVVIGSSRCRDDIYTELQQRGIQNIYEYGGTLHKKIQAGNYEYDSLAWYTVISQSCRKAIFVYGTSETGREFAEKLNLSDVKIAGFLEDEVFEEELSGIPVIAASQIAQIDRESTMIYIFDDVAARVGELKKMGWKFGYHFRPGAYLTGGKRAANPYMYLDANCGYAYVDDEKLPGYTVSGASDDHCRIMILGASATDDKYHYFRTWSAWMTELLQEEGYKIQICNGAMEAYTSQQNLLKLIRDLPQVKPDLVIDYGGALNAMNFVHQNAFIDYRYPFSNPPFATLLKKVRYNHRCFAEPETVEAVSGYGERKGLYQGTEHENTSLYESASDSYLYATGCMNAICAMQGIPFFSFLDPVLIYTDVIGKKDFELLYHEYAYAVIADMRRQAIDFRKRTVERMNPEFQYDLTRIFDGKDGMYDDAWHPNEEGNLSIAKQIAAIIRKEIEKRETQITD